MLKKPISHGDYEKIMKMSYNNFSKWYRAIIDEMKEVAISTAIREVKLQMAGDPEADVYAWDADALRERLSERGFDGEAIERIIDAIIT